MRFALLGLAAATCLSTAAYAQFDPSAGVYHAEPATMGGSPFGAASAPLSTSEMKAIKEEGAARRAAAAAAAKRAQEKREAAMAAKAEKEAAKTRAADAAAAAAAAPVDSMTPPAGAMSGMPESAAVNAPTPAGAPSPNGSTTIIPNAVVDPSAPGGVSAAPMPAPMPEPAAPTGAPVPAPDAPMTPGGTMKNDGGMPPLPTGEEN